MNTDEFNNSEDSLEGVDTDECCYQCGANRASGVRMWAIEGSQRECVCESCIMSVDSESEIY